MPEPALQDQRARVDDAIEPGVARHGLHHRRAVDRHQDGRRVADEHLRRIVLHLDRRRLDAGDRERGLQPVERDRADLGAEFLLQLGHVRRAAIRQRREVDLADVHVLEDDGARHLVDLRAGGREDHAERLVLRAGDLDRERRAEVDLVAVPLVHLRLVDEHLPVGEVDDARPRVRGKLRRSGRGRTPRGPQPAPAAPRRRRKAKTRAAMTGGNALADGEIHVSEGIHGLAAGGRGGAADNYRTTPAGLSRGLYWPRTCRAARTPGRPRKPADIRLLLASAATRDFRSNDHVEANNAIAHR